MKHNKKSHTPRTFTHEGAPASKIGAEEQLRRTVMTCMLGEDVHYETGETAKDRIAALIPQCRPEFVAACAYEARSKMHMRHVPLFIVREMVRYPQHKKLVRQLLPDVIQRADELAEFMAMYMTKKRQFVSNPVRRGLAKAFENFNEFELAKYNRDANWKLRDVMFVSHPSRTQEDPPKETIVYKRVYNNGEGAIIRHPGSVLARIASNTLKTPETWETLLSSGANKRETFEKLILERQLGGLAFVRNFRNMHQAGVPYDMVNEYAKTVNISRVLPFRFVATARACPEWSDIANKLLLRSCEGTTKFAGKTIIVVDVSGSMNAMLNHTSDMNRIDAGAALAAIMREQCEQAVVYATGDGTILIPSHHRGLSMVEAIKNSGAGFGGIFIHRCLEQVYAEQKTADRIIVVTDEQDCDPSNTAGRAFAAHNYIINVAQYDVGVSYKKPWKHIHGWSEQVLEYIKYVETNPDVDR